jgi:hypothetical protein
LVQYDVCQANATNDPYPHTPRISLAEDWPWWGGIPEYDIVKAEMQADSRWKEWVSKLQ